MANLNPFNLIGVNVSAPPAPGYTRGTRVTAPNGHYLDFASDVTWGTFADGQPWFINDGVALAGRYPAGRNYAGNNIDGYTLNPTIGGPQGLDQRRPNYVAPAAINTITPRKMDVILSGECEETSPAGTWRDGYFKNHGQAWFTCLTKPPPVGEFSPPIHWPSDDVNRLLRPRRVPDIDGMLARLPSYSTAGITSPPTWASFATSWNQPNAAWLHTMSPTAVDAGGYEGGFPRDFTTAPGNANFGGYIAVDQNQVLGAATLGHWSAADKREFLVRLCQHGNQWIEPSINGANDQMVPDGGHWQWHWPACAAWLDATGQNARSAALYAKYKGNYDQVFAATASNVANDFVPHTSTTKPFTWRQRTLSSVSGLNMTLQSFAQDNPNFFFTNLRLKRVSDGDEALITSGGTYAITVDQQASPVWANADTVYMVPGYTITAGQLLWTIKGPSRLDYFNPSPVAAYYELQAPAMQVYFLRALGIVAPELENFADFWALVIAGNYPAAAPYAYSDPRNMVYHSTAQSLFETQVWDAHWTAASAVPSRF